MPLLYETFRQFNKRIINVNNVYFIFLIYRKNVSAKRFLNAKQFTWIIIVSAHECTIYWLRVTLEKQNLLESREVSSLLSWVTAIVYDLPKESVDSS